MRNARLASTLLNSAALFSIAIHAFAVSLPHSPQVPDVPYAAAAMTPREEAAEDRAEIALRIRRENADRHYVAALKHCGVQQAAPQGECAARAQAEHAKALDDAEAAYDVSHSRALLLGKFAQ